MTLFTSLSAVNLLRAQNSPGHKVYIFKITVYPIPVMYIRIYSKKNNHYDQKEFK
jgi:hypothetical protein